LYPNIGIGFIFCRRRRLVDDDDEEVVDSRRCCGGGCDMRRGRFGNIDDDDNDDDDGTGRCDVVVGDGGGIDLAVELVVAESVVVLPILVSGGCCNHRRLVSYFHGVL
jgi:hypothetical protein